MSKTTFTLKRKQYAIPGLGFGSQAFKQISKNNSFGKNAALAGKGALGALGSTALVGGTLAAGGAALGKGVVSKASEQSDGSKVFSQINNDNMATTYTLKRKTFSENEKNGSNLGKIALGTAATAGLAFAGARRGMLGTGAMKSTNAMWAKAGNKIGAQGMVKSGSRGVGVAMAKEKGLDLGTMNGKKYAIKKSNQFQNQKLTSPTPSVS